MADSRNIRGVTFGLAIATTATLIVGIAPAALAETRTETAIATVSGADPIRTSYIRKTPKDERV